MRRLLFPLVMLLSACTAMAPVHMYDGQPHALSDLALVRAEGDHEHTVLQGLDARMYITSVDGKDTYQFFGGMWNHPDVVYVLPGPHHYRLLWNQLGTIANPQVSFVAAAGRRYLIHKVEHRAHVSVWVEDTTTGGKVD